MPGFAALVHHSDVYQDTIYADDAGLKRCFTIPNGIDPEELDAASSRGFRQTLGVGSRRLVLAVSNHTGGKGHDLVIRAFQEFAPADAVLAIVGNESPDGCIDQCRSVQDKRVLILEDLSRELVVQAFKESDVFVLGSQIEAAPLVLLEAAAAGLPWLSTPVGNVKELGGGIVAEPKQFAEKLKQLLQNKRLREELGEQGREWSATRPQLPQIHDRYEQLFQRVVEGELCGAPVPAEVLAMDMEKKLGLEAFARSEWASAMTHLMHSLESDPTGDGLRLTLLHAMMRAGQRAPLMEVYELVQDELELAPWASTPNMLLFFLAGALGLDLDLQEAEARAASLGMPCDELLGLAGRGRELGEQGEDAVQEAVMAMVAG